MNKIEKVYCRNCRFYWDRRFVYSYTPKSDVCLELSKVYKDVIGIERVKNMVDCLKANKDYNCKYYKRKWWKFWVK